MRSSGIVILKKSESANIHESPTRGKGIRRFTIKCSPHNISRHENVCKDEMYMLVQE